MARRPAELVTARYLHEQLGISYSYIRRVLTGLAGHGLVHGKKGIQGGFTFAKPTSEIKVADIIRSVQGFDSFQHCLLGFEACSEQNPCEMHELWKGINDQMVQTLSQTAISELNQKPV